MALQKETLRLEHLKRDCGGSRLVHGDRKGISPRCACAVNVDLR
jgi:hypothetical protein